MIGDDTDDDSDDDDNKKSVICFVMVWFGFNVFVDDYYLSYSNGLLMLMSFEYE